MEFITLLGAEDVQRAGHTMSSAAQDMKMAASSLDDTLHRQRLFLDDWLMRFENIIEQSTVKLKGE
jgi:hypothetical protein